MAAGAESIGYYGQFNPLLNQAGVKWLRLFPEWQTLEPKQGQFDWTSSDKLVADARANHLHMLGTWLYFAPWASADGGTRKGPIRHMQFWRDYVSATVGRYHKDIKYWEVWNEFNGSFYEGRDGADRVKDYADFVVAAYDAAKAIDPDAKVGMSVASFDAAFLDAAIKAGAAGHFDFICVHPYDNLGTLAEGGEVGFLNMEGYLRAMLKANGQPVDTPLWITEVGDMAPSKAEPVRDAHQADMLAKAYLATVAQGFQRVFWFEARGPAYEKDAEFGVIRQDWTPRPSYVAYKTMTAMLGAEPKPLGWLDLGRGGYGFLFAGKGGPVLAAWSSAGQQSRCVFGGEVRVSDLAGRETKLPGGQELVLTESPVLISHLPGGLVAQAKANRGKAYPWGGDHSRATVVSCRLGAVNREDGVTQVHPHTTVVVNGPEGDCRRTSVSDPALHGEGHYVYFLVHPSFVPYGTRRLEITVVAKRSAPDKEAGMTVEYESTSSYKGGNTWWALPADDQWHEHTWKVDDACFVGMWGYNFRVNCVGSPNDFLLSEVRVSRGG
jgi:hypothetical protein